MNTLRMAGVLISLVGLSLLWRARRDVLYWLRFFFRIFDKEVARRGGIEDGKRAVPSGSSPLSDTPAQRRTAATLCLVGGLALMFLGQLLLVLDLAF